MASHHHHSHLLFLTTLLTFLTLSTARPCKTIIFISTSTSTSFTQTQKPTFLTVYFTTTPQTNPTNTFFATIESVEPQLVQNYNPNSIRDRTLDILSIVGALLFGVGSGALTAATIYLVWYSFFEGRFDFGGDEDSDEEMDYSPKKMGYVVVDSGDSGAKQVD